MNSEQFEKLAFEVTKQKIKLYEYMNEKEKYKGMIPFNSTLEPEKSYGVCIDGVIEYHFKTTKKVETFFKSFITQHINKYEMKQCVYQIVNGFFEQIKPKKEDIFKKYTSDRVSKYHFYTTLYGIGMFAFFTRDILKATKKLSDYLKSKNVSYYNEYSDAGWAYRFVINKDVETHNKLLEDFNLN